MDINCHLGLPLHVSKIWDGQSVVGYTFAPIILVWFRFNAEIFMKYDPAVVKAINPAYIIDYFRRNKKDAWITHGGVVLAITGHLTINLYLIKLCQSIHSTQLLVHALNRTV